MDFLKGKAKLAYEAFSKIEQGKKLMEEGRIELSSLISDGSLNVMPTVAAKMLRRTNIDKKTRRPPRSMEVAYNLVVKKLEEHPEGITSHRCEKDLALSYSRVHAIKNRLITEGKIIILDDGPAQKMVLIKFKKK
jgi:hypothetical protein